ncbi:MAG: hypothetical protein ACXABI_05985, partial [Candidatus Hodarchaeales archaeon]
MSNALISFSRKNWNLKIFVGMMMIFVICLPNITTQAVSRQAIKPLAELVRESQTDLEDTLIQDSDLGQMQEDAYDEISNQIKPKNESFPIYSSEFSEISNAINEQLYTSWIDDPSYSFMKQEVLGWDITTIQAPEQAVSIHETTTADGGKLVRKTIYSERPTIEILSTGDSIINNINVPVLPEPAGSGAAVVPEYHTEKQRINFGWGISSGRRQEVFSRTIFNPMKIWPYLPGYKVEVGAYFEFTFHLYFPVDVTITHPTTIYVGQSYDFNVTVEPIDNPTMKEFQYLLDAGAWWTVYQGWYTPAGSSLKWCSGWLGIPYICGTYSWPERTDWYGVAGDSWDVNDIIPAGYSAASADYRTPLGGNSIPIPLPEIDLLEIIGLVVGPVGLLANIFSASVSLGTANVYGDAVTAIMSILTDHPEDQLVTFTDKDRQTKRMMFTIPDSEQIPEVKFTVSQFEYKLREIVFNPYFYLGFDNFDFWGFTIPLRDWWGGITIPLPQFSIPINGVAFGSDFIYRSGGIGVTEDYDAIYDFSMTVSDYYLGSSLSGPIQRYWIDLNNPNLRGHQDDVIKLSVSGLPQGY